MCCNETTCSARGEDVGLPIVRDMRYLDISISRFVLGYRNGLIR